MECKFRKILSEVVFYYNDYDFGMLKLMVCVGVFLAFPSVHKWSQNNVLSISLDASSDAGNKNSVMPSGDTVSEIPAVCDKKT